MKIYRKAAMIVNTKNKLIRTNKPLLVLIIQFICAY